MKEDFLHYLWKYNYFDHSDLKTTTGLPITIQSNGVHNHDSGPDFSHGNIFIDQMQWIGQIEIHINSSDWYKHGHQHDTNYENVILHVVWKDDKPVTNGKGVRLPTLELFNRIDLQLIDKYESLIIQNSWIACADNLHDIDKCKVSMWLDGIAIEKLEQKSKLLLAELEMNTFHWKQVFMSYLFKAFGLKVNQDAFHCLAQSLSYELVYKYSHNLIQLEALLFGQAGMLSEKWTDSYAKRLLKEYRFIKHKHSLASIPLSYWKFSKLRPANFPTIRIAQLAQLLHKTPTIFSIVLDSNIQELYTIFDEICASKYWNTHYRFDKESKSKVKMIGKDRIRLIFINCMSPVLFVYGKYRDLPQYINKSIHVLESLPAESNGIIKHWQKESICAKNALQSQALIFLKKSYCDQFKCVSCQIGHQLLSPQKRNE